MPHQRDCPRLARVVSYSSDLSGYHVGPLVGVTGATVRHFNRVAGHATPQLQSTTAKGATTTTEHVDDSFRRDGNGRNRGQSLPFGISFND